MYTIFWTNEARSTFESVLAYLSERNVNAARQLHHKIDAALRQISLFPHSGPPSGPLSSIRRISISHYPYSIYYKAEEISHRIIILRVRHEKRKYP